MHLLATAPECRRMGIGRALVDAAMDHAGGAGLHRMLLWTQASMQAAQRLYVSAGFARRPARDFREGGRAFLFFAADLRPAATPGRDAGGAVGRRSESDRPPEARR